MPYYEQLDTIEIPETPGMVYPEIGPMEFDDEGRLTSLDMVPVELGFMQERAYKGLPVRANAEMSQRIFERLCTLSEPYGTQLQLEDGVIIARIGE